MIVFRPAAIAALSKREALLVAGLAQCAVGSWSEGKRSQTRFDTISDLNRDLLDDSSRVCDLGVRIEHGRGLMMVVNSRRCLS